MTPRMIVRLVLCGAALFGCDGTATSTGTSREQHEGGPPVGGEAGTFACGPLLCLPTEICVYPPCGCIVETARRTDAGPCPAGFEPWDDARTCSRIGVSALPLERLPPRCLHLVPVEPRKDLCGC